MAIQNRITVAPGEPVISGEEFRRDRRGTPATSGLDWDDARVFLAVARYGSLRAAGRALGLSQPTIGRRLAAFEATFGGPTLFDRLPEGLRLNAAGEALLPAAEQLESAAWALERRRAATSPALSGTVRVSVGEWAASFLARFSPAHRAPGSRQGLPSNSSKLSKPPTSHAAKPISRCATIRLKAETSTSPRPACSPAPSITGPAQLVTPG